MLGKIRNFKASITDLDKLSCAVEICGLGLSYPIGENSAKAVSFNKKEKKERRDQQTNNNKKPLTLACAHRFIWAGCFQTWYIDK